MSQDCVLVVDDDDDIRNTIAMLLEMHGYSVQLADGAQTALALLRRGYATGDGPRPKLVLLDLMMPGMNGLEFRREQLRDPAIAAVPVVVLSGAGQLSARAVGHGLETLQKPISLDALLDTVARFCAAPAPSAPHASST